MTMTNFERQLPAVYHADTAAAGPASTRETDDAFLRQSDREWLEAMADDPRWHSHEQRRARQVARRLGGTAATDALAWQQLEALAATDDRFVVRGSYGRGVLTLSGGTDAVRPLLSTFLDYCSMRRRGALYLPASAVEAQRLLNTGRDR